MESGHHEDSANSSSSEEEEEVDQPEEEDNNDVGMGRSYECVFCRRGFNTAQALGGHMNIHRKDRAKINRPINSNKQDEFYIRPSAISSYQSRYEYSPAHQEAQVSYRTYFPASTSGARPSYNQSNEFCGHHIPQLSSPFGDHDWRMGLSLQFGLAHAEDEEKKSGGSEEDELDLELRLGQNP